MSMKRGKLNRRKSKALFRETGLDLLLARAAASERLTDTGDTASMDTAVFKMCRGYPKTSPRIPRPMPGAQVTVLQVVNGGNCVIHTGLSGDIIVSQQLADTAFVLAFGLQDLLQASSFTGVWDQYRIEKIKAMFVATASEVTYSTTATAPPAVPPLAIVVDYDDSTVLGSMAAALNYDNIQLLAPYQSCSVEIIPKFAPTVWNSGVASGFSTKASIDEWIDVASPAIPFFGIKGYVSADASSTGHQSWRVYVEYVVSFKNIH